MAWLERPRILAPQVGGDRPAGRCRRRAHGGPWRRPGRLRVLAKDADRGHRVLLEPRYRPGPGVPGPWLRRRSAAAAGAISLPAHPGATDPGRERGNPYRRATR